MSDFKAKMHQIRFRLGSAPDPAGGELTALPRQRSPDPLAGFNGPTSKDRGGRGRRRGGKRRGREGRVGEGKGRKGMGQEEEEWEGDSFGPRSGPPTFLRIYAHVPCNRR